jgi:hypothetical protein
VHKVHKDFKKFCKLMTEIVKAKKVFRIPYASRHRHPSDKNNRRSSEPQHIGEILPAVMAKVKKRISNNQVPNENAQ